MRKFVRSLDPAGKAAPQALAPGEQPNKAGGIIDTSRTLCSVLLQTSHYRSLALLPYN